MKKRFTPDTRVWAPGSDCCSRHKAGRFPAVVIEFQSDPMEVVVYFLAPHKCMGWRDGTTREASVFVDELSPRKQGEGL